MNLVEDNFCVWGFLGFAVFEVFSGIYSIHFTWFWFGNRCTGFFFNSLYSWWRLSL